MIRYFKLFYEDMPCSRYSGESIIIAAQKAFTAIYKTNPGIKPNQEIKFGLRETTRGCKHKEYYFYGQRIECENKIVNIDGRPITYKYTNHIRRYRAYTKLENGEIILHIEI